MDNNTAYSLHVDSVLREIESARLSVSKHHIVKVVAVSKYVSSKAISKLYGIGQRAFGENKVQDLKQKTKELESLPLEWHFIGSLQKNKINNLLDLEPFLLHSLESIELAYALEKKLQQRGMYLNTLLQINSAKEESKHGFMPEVAKEMYEQIQSECPHINLKGVMSIGAHTDESKKVQHSFETTRRIFDSLKGATICSMGMSGDFKLAIECGSTMVRLGSILFPKEL